jgi:hypothetical protein
VTIASFFVAAAAARVGICSRSRMSSGIVAAQTTATAPSVARLARSIVTSARSRGLRSQTAQAARSGGSNAGTRIDHPPGRSKLAALATKVAIAEMGKRTPAPIAAQRGAPVLTAIRNRMPMTIHSITPKRIA